VRTINTTTLHEAQEPRHAPFERGRMYSMLDLLGGGTATCDDCHRWQRFSSLDPRRSLAQTGWTFEGGKDLCPVCSPKRNQTEREKGAP